MSGITIDLESSHTRENSSKLLGIFFENSLLLINITQIHVWEHYKVHENVFSFFIYNILNFIFDVCGENMKIDQRKITVFRAKYYIWNKIKGAGGNIFLVPIYSCVEVTSYSFNALGLALFF